MILAQGESKDFLGQEFLTWLWYYGENHDWGMEIKNLGRIHYGLDELLVMQPDETQGCKQRLSGVVPVASPEAHAALKEGKKVTVTRVVLALGEKEWFVTWRADNFQFSSLKLMQPTTTEPADRFGELSQDLEQVTALFEGMYEQFLSIRLSSDWQEKELPQIQTWIQNREDKAG